MQAGAARADTPLVMRTEARDDQGFTLIELVMALTVLAIAIFGIVSVFSASIRTGAVDVHRTNAVALASRWDEQMATIAYAQLGLAAADTSVACDSGASIVVVNQPGVTATDALPTTVAGVSYTVSRCVVWVADSKATTTTAYKRTTAMVSWTDEVGPHAVRQDSAVYPGGLGSLSASSTTTTTVSCGATPPSPSPALSAPLPLPTPVSVRLTWLTPSVSPVPVAAWQVTYSSDSFVTTNVFADRLIAAPPGQSNEAIVSGLAPSTAYGFQVIALACGLSSTPAATSATTGPDASAATCAVGLVSVTPLVAQRAAGGTPNLAPGSVIVAASTNGQCLALTAKYQPTVGTNSLVTLAPVTGNPNQWQGTLPAGGSSEAWDLGPHIIFVWSGATVLGQATVCIVNPGAFLC